MFQSEFGLDQPTGHVVHNVMDELSKLQKTDKNISKVADLKNGGLKIITTIDKPTQEAAEKYADLQQQGRRRCTATRPNLTAALVAVEPYTGRVMAYYGGPKGDGADYAGNPTDPVLGDGEMQTAASTRRPRRSRSTRWVPAWSTDLRQVHLGRHRRADFPGRPKGAANAVKNANAEGACNGTCAAAGTRR